MAERLAISVLGLKNKLVYTMFGAPKHQEAIFLNGLLTAAPD